MLLNDQQCASSSMDGTIILWNINSAIPLSKLKVLSVAGSLGSPDSDNIKYGVLSLAYNYQQHVLISCGQDRRLTFWEMNQHKAYRIIQASYDGDLN
jgi:WD40 repeat protein